MDENLLIIENERKKIRKFILIMNIIAVFSIIAGLGLMFLFGPIPLFIFIIIAAFLFIVAAINKSKFRKDAKEKVISQLVKSELGDDAIYNATSGIPLEDILSQGIYLKPDRCFLEDYICATYNEIKYEMCDCKLQEMEITYDSKGNQHTRYITYFNGRVIKIDFKRDIDFKMKVIEGSPKGLKTTGLEKLETEVIQFNKKFKLFVNDKVNAFYYLTPSLINKMLELEGMFNGSIQYTMDGDFFYIFINNSKNSLELSLSKPINAEAIELLKKDLLIGATIINEFNLDKKKFNKNIEI